MMFRTGISLLVTTSGQEMEPARGTQLHWKISVILLKVTVNISSVITCHHFKHSVGSCDLHL